MALGVNLAGTRNIAPLASLAPLACFHHLANSPFSLIGAAFCWPLLLAHSKMTRLHSKTLSGEKRVCGAGETRGQKKLRVPMAESAADPGAKQLGRGAELSNIDPGARQLAPSLIDSSESWATLWTPAASMTALQAVSDAKPQLEQVTLQLRAWNMFTFHGLASSKRLWLRIAWPSGAEAVAWWL